MLQLSAIFVFVLCFCLCCCWVFVFFIFLFGGGRHRSKSGSPRKSMAKPWRSTKKVCMPHSRVSVSNRPGNTERSHPGGWWSVASRRVAACGPPLGLWWETAPPACQWPGLGLPQHWCRFGQRLETPRAHGCMGDQMPVWVCEACQHKRKQQRNKIWEERAWNKDMPTNIN